MNRNAGLQARYKGTQSAAKHGCARLPSQVARCSEVFGQGWSLHSLLGCARVPLQPWVWCLLLLCVAVHVRLFTLYVWRFLSCCMNTSNCALLSIVGQVALQIISMLACSLTALGRSFCCCQCLSPFYCMHSSYYCLLLNAG